MSVVRLRPYSAEGGFLHGFDAELGTIVSLDLRRVAWAEETDEVAVSRSEAMRFDFRGPPDDFDADLLLEVADWGG